MKLKRIGSNQTQITTAGGTEVLFSYDTPVACFVPGEGYYRTEEKFSATSSKHINKWLEGVNADVMPQSFFEELVK